MAVALWRTFGHALAPEQPQVPATQTSPPGTPTQSALVTHSQWWVVVLQDDTPGPVHSALVEHSQSAVTVLQVAPEVPGQSASPAHPMKQTLLLHLPAVLPQTRAVPASGAPYLGRVRGSVPGKRQPRSGPGGDAQSP